MHAVDLVHGDIQPDNILVADTPGEEPVRLVNFGMSDRLGGTLAYAAPAQAHGRPPTPASDIYSLGAVVFQLLHGRLPHPEVDVRRAQDQGVEEGRPVDRLVRRMLQAEPDRRPTAEQAAAALVEQGAGPPSLALSQLRARALGASVVDTTTREAVDRWLDAGGVLSFTSDDGLATRQALDWTAIHLVERSIACVRVKASLRPWQVVEDIVQHPALPGPRAALPSGEITIHIRAEDETIEWSIRDDGPGCASPPLDLCVDPHQHEPRL